MTTIEQLTAELAEARAKIARLEAAYFSAADFKVVCSQCQCDDQFGNADRCTKAGWIDIEIDQGFAWNFVGICPSCRAKDAEAPAAPAITDDDIDADEPFAPLRKG